MEMCGKQTTDIQNKTNEKKMNQDLKDHQKQVNDQPREQTPSNDKANKDVSLPKDHRYFSKVYC